MKPGVAAMRCLRHALAIGLLAMAGAAAADDYKIGVLNVERVLQQAPDAKAAHDRIEQAFKARDADIARKEQDVRAAAEQLARDRATLSSDERASRERSIEARTREVQRLREQFAEDLRARQFEELDKLKEHAAQTGRTPVQFALAWLWANRIVSSVIAGPRTLAQWQDYVAAIGTPWSAQDEALVDSLVRPGHPSTPGYSDPAYPIYGRRLAQR
jgi:Skp family chaperone for outer membrane proteins